MRKIRSYFGEGFRRIRAKIGDDYRIVPLENPVYTLDIEYDSSDYFFAIFLNNNVYKISAFELSRATHVPIPKEILRICCRAAYEGLEPHVWYDIEEEPLVPMEVVEIFTNKTYVASPIIEGLREDLEPIEESPTVKWVKRCPGVSGEENAFEEFLRERGFCDGFGEIAHPALIRRLRNEFRRKYIKVRVTGENVKYPLEICVPKGDLEKVLKFYSEKGEV